MADGGESPAVIVENVGAENPGHVAGIGGLARPGDDVGFARIGHLERREQGKARLLAGAVHAAVPGQPPGRTVVDAVVALVVGLEEMLGELRHRLQIFERRHGAQAGLLHILAAQLDGERIGRAEGMGGIVAACAGHLAGGGEGRVEEQGAAERFQRRRAGISLRTAHAGGWLGGLRQCAGNSTSQRQREQSSPDCSMTHRSATPYGAVIQPVCPLPGLPIARWRRSVTGF